MRSNSRTNHRVPPGTHKAHASFSTVGRKKSAKMHKCHALPPPKKMFSSAAAAAQQGSIISDMTSRVFPTDGSIESSRQKKHLGLDFDDARTIYSQFSTPQLLFTNTIYSLCRFKPLVDYSPFLIRTSRNLLGDKFVTNILKKTIYKQFCIGEDAQSIAGPITKAASSVC